MRIDLIYRKVCDTCEGDGELLHLEGATRDDDYMVHCPDCTDGYTEETMVFGGDALDTQGGSWDYLEINGSNILRQFPDLKWVVYDAYSKIITKDLNPQSLHIIEEKECPDCKGDYVGEKITSPPYKIPVCKNCTSGKISVETSFTVFGKSENEYRKELLKEGFTENELNSEE